MKYKGSLQSSLRKFRNKRTYKNPNQLLAELLKRRQEVSQDRYMGKALKLVIRELVEQGILSEELGMRANRLIKVKRVGVDNYVPTTREIQEMLSQLPQDKRRTAEFLLYSGIRITEAEYILKHRRTLKTQDLGLYYKININYIREKKKCFICYISKPQWDYFLQAHSNALSSLQRHIRRHKLLPLKYFRKYFYTSAIGVGCPSEVADFIQGRVQTTVGGRSYLAVQRLADEWYWRVVEGIARS